MVSNRSAPVFPAKAGMTFVKGGVNGYVSLFIVYYLYAYWTERYSVDDGHLVKHLSRLFTPLDYRWHAVVAFGLFGLVGLIQYFTYLFVFSK